MWQRHVRQQWVGCTPHYSLVVAIVTRCTAVCSGRCRHVAESSEQVCDGYGGCHLHGVCHEVDDVCDGLIVGLFHGEYE